MPIGRRRCPITASIACGRRCWPKTRPTCCSTARRSLAVLRPLPSAGRSDFGWTLPGGEEPLAYGPLATLLGQAGLGWAKMPVWYDPRETAKADRIAWFAEQLSIQGIELVGVLDQPPPELREVFREQGRLPVATVFAEPELWQPAVGPIMTRLSLKVHWWQLGDDNDVSFVGYPQLEAKLAEIKKHLEQYGQQIHLGINWRWIYAPPKASGQRPAPWAYLSYGIDPPLTAEELAAYLQTAASAASRLPRASRQRREPPTTNAAIAPRRGRTPVARLPPARRASAGPLRWVRCRRCRARNIDRRARARPRAADAGARRCNGAEAVVRAAAVRRRAGNHERRRLAGRAVRSLADHGDAGRRHGVSGPAAASRRQHRPRVCPRRPGRDGRVERPPGDGARVSRRRRRADRRLGPRHQAAAAPSRTASCCTS